MRRILIFLLGVREFHLDLTTSFEDHDDLRTYDLGREWAHRLTFRRFDWSR